MAGFMFSICLVVFSKLKHLILGFVLSVLLVILCVLYIPKIVLALGVFLPTLIHVYVFTLLFMIYGQIKEFSRTGLVCILLLVVIPIVIWLTDLSPSLYSISEFTKSTYLRSGLLSINKVMANLLGDISAVNFNLLAPIVVKIQMFIAFAYTYHYLNWFSKTSIIGWKKSLSSSRMKYIVFFWLVAVGIYLYDYITGLTVLFFLSLLHVVLEFPLNVITIKELIKVANKRLKGKSK